MLKIIFFKTINVYLNINFQSRTFAHPISMLPDNFDSVQAIH